MNRMTQMSPWPSLVRADSVQTAGVRHGTKLLMWASTLMLVLVTVAGTVTPLGLSETVRAAPGGPTAFQYVRDAGPFGQSTPPRPAGFAFSRVCGMLLPENCPGTYAGVQTIRNRSGVFSIPDSPVATISTALPGNLTELFSSRTGDAGSTLSGLFDIQYRLYEGTRSPYIDHGRTYIRGSFRGVQRLVLRNATDAVEGLVVDTRTGTGSGGGIGFRNHTVPASLAMGGTWSEDLTWIEPLTECVDTNLTFQFDSQDRPSNTSAARTYLVDRGGFARLAPRFPFPGFPLWNDTQNPAELRLRAYKAAWMSNALAAIFLNLTSVGHGGIAPVASGVGQKHMIAALGSPLIDFGTVSLSPINGGFLQLGFGSGSGFGSESSARLNLTAEARARLSISASNFTDAGTLCAGTTFGTPGNASNVAVRCGYVFGAAHLADGRDSLLFAPNSTYERNLFVCASAMRASIKTVDFAINGPAALANLRITAVRAKTYADGSAADDADAGDAGAGADADHAADGSRARPLWAVENSGRLLRDVAPLWGLVADRFAGTPGFDFVRANALLLPAAYPDPSITGSADSLAAKDVFAAALQSVWQGGDEAASGVPDYSGNQDFAMFTAWKRMTRSAADAGAMVNLVLTDLLAAATVGTKSGLAPALKPARAGRMDELSPSNGTPPALRVAELRRAIAYNALYAVPAAVVLALWATVAAAAALMWLRSRFTLESARQLLNQTATGRIAVSLLHPAACDPTAPTPAWQRSAGRLRLRFHAIPPSPPSARDPLPSSPPVEKRGAISLSSA